MGITVDDSPLGVNGIQSSSIQVTIDIGYSGIPSETTASSQSCIVGSENCHCTTGGGCDPGLICQDGFCSAEIIDSVEEGKLLEF